MATPAMSAPTAAPLVTWPATVRAPMITTTMPSAVEGQPSVTAQAVGREDAAEGRRHPPRQHGAEDRQPAARDHQPAGYLVDVVEGAGRLDRGGHGTGRSRQVVDAAVEGSGSGQRLTPPPCRGSLPSARTVRPTSATLRDGHGARGIDRRSSSGYGAPVPKGRRTGRAARSGNEHCWWPVSWGRPWRSRGVAWPRRRRPVRAASSTRRPSAAPTAGSSRASPSRSS